MPGHMLVQQCILLLLCKPDSLLVSEKHGELQEDYFLFTNKYTMVKLKRWKCYSLKRWGMKPRWSASPDNGPSRKPLSHVLAHGYKRCVLAHFKHTCWTFRPIIAAGGNLWRCFMVCTLQIYVISSSTIMKVSCKSYICLSTLGIHYTLLQSVNTRLPPDWY